MQNWYQRCLELQKDNIKNMNVMYEWAFYVSIGDFICAKVQFTFNIECFIFSIDFFCFYCLYQEYNNSTYVI